MGERLGGIVRLAARRPLAVLGVVGLLALAGAVLALRLEPERDPDTLVNRSSDTFKATERFKKTFGDEAVVILVKGDLQRTVLTSDLGRLLGLEGCLSGNVPKQGLAQLPKSCTDIAKLKPAKVGLRPGDVHQHRGRADLRRVRQAPAGHRAAGRAGGRWRARRRPSAARPRPQQERLWRPPRQEVNQEFTRQVLQIALRYGLSSPPSIDSADFVSGLVFDTAAGEGASPSAFAYLFPSQNAAMIQVRLQAGPSNASGAGRSS